MEKISVIIPTYNRCDVLKRAMDSVLQQTYCNIELLIVDDGSTDNTQQLVESMEDSRIRYIKLLDNRGAANARNEGVLRATGEWIAFQDSDDCWRPDKLEKQVKYMQEKPQFSMIYCQYVLHMGNELLQVPEEDWNGLEGDIFAWILLRNSVGTPTMLIRRECFEDVGGFDNTLKCLEDWEFVIRFSEKYMVGYIDEVLVDAYHVDESVSSKVGLYFESRCRIIFKYREYLEKFEMLDIVVWEMFDRAEQLGVLSKVRDMFSAIWNTGEKIIP